MRHIPGWEVTWAGQGWEFRGAFQHHSQVSLSSEVTVKQVPEGNDRVCGKAKSLGLEHGWQVECLQEPQLATEE